MEDGRRFCRVSIHLPVAVRQQDSQVFLTESLDISEGGVLLKNNIGADLNAGDVVKVHIDGILGEDQNKMILHPMRVVRVDEDQIALEFV
ncbi:MAG: PilZ domain-containing protein [Kangiellaceae bacterium]|nr:PilZ domain-containing protein [Kangiellaceae bacterium]